jgi:hypothetical protein
VLIYLRWVGAGRVAPLALPQDAGERLQLAEEAAFYGLPELEECSRRPRISQFELLQVRKKAEEASSLNNYQFLSLLIF